MKKKIIALLLVVTLLFSYGLNIVSAQEEEQIVEFQEEEKPEVPAEGSENTTPEQDGGEAGVPGWTGIDEDEVSRLYALYEVMTNTGKAYSGWFGEGDYQPCGWNGITCEENRVIGLTFENAGYFTTFPEAILEFRDLKELRMVDTMMRGVLPDTLFSSFPKLESLVISGNFLSGEIPALPEYFELYPMLNEIVLSDNRADDGRKVQLLSDPAYADVANYQPDQSMYNGMDAEPGLDGIIPADWNRLPSLGKIDLSGNALHGEVPDSFSELPLYELDLSNNGELFSISTELYDHLVANGLNLDGVQEPVIEEPVIEEPTEEPWVPEEPVIEEPTEEPWVPEEPVIEQPTEEPWVPEEPVIEQPTEEPWAPEEPIIEEPIIEEPTAVPVIPDPVIIPTEIPVQPEPTMVSPTEVPREPDPIDIDLPVPPEKPAPKPTDVPVDPLPPVIDLPVLPEPTRNPGRPVSPTQPPQKPIIIVVTATPIPWYTAVPQQPYYPPQYPTVQPQYPQYPQYPTATPYSNNIPGWVYPTATPYYTYPQYGQNPLPTATAVPTLDPAASLGFTYVLETMTENSIPMTWRYTGMREYSINYLDAQGNLYPAFAMEWKPAEAICNASVCNATVENIPDELLRGGVFSLQLRVRDAAGKTYDSDPVQMKVSLPEPVPTPTPEPPKSLWRGFFEWLFGPIIRLFGGK